MRHLFIMLMVGLLGFGLSVEHAEAKRLGGGKSFGSYSRSADSGKSSSSLFGSNKTTSGTTAKSKPSNSLSKFAGPMAGLLAGGLLASLFFGGAFDGLRMTDFLIIALIAFVAFKFLSARRKATMASGGPAGRTTRHDDQPRNAQAREQHGQGESLASASGTGAGLAGTPSIGEPAWFDKEQFLGGAKEHFMTLQRAWDNNDLPRIQEYVTPTLYNLLREERAKQPANNQTEIIRLFAELSSVQEIGQQAEATVLFHGVLNENGEQNEFSETWHLIRELRDGADWYIQGIEQNS
ncbi:MULTISPECIES: Tim44 domain-containing protein [Cobetia]|uniref:Tim44 domain-containing protein n=1 Tax=Cobetia TaxID=204286 RepID=UPI0004699E95|nr:MULTISPECIES: Tim44-like domain-containing protein [Cobetia]